MEKDLLRVSIRQGAIFVPDEILPDNTITQPTLQLVSLLRSIGYAVSEPLLHVLNGMAPTQQAEVLGVVNEVMGVGLNWAPLVKGWQVPTGESFIDHIITFVANYFGDEVQMNGTRLPCGHLIPDGTFPLERYNGCPFCGTPFQTSTEIYRGQGSKLKTLTLWRRADVEKCLENLLASPVALDATQADSLKLLLKHLPLPQNVEIGIKETLVLAVDALQELGKEAETCMLFSSPTDVLRYLWYKHTGQLQLVEPRVLISNARYAHAHIFALLDRSQQGAEQKRTQLKLKYNRTWCRRVATWLNTLPMAPEKACETMHAKRQMWVRMIRALRLSEYAKRDGFDRLRELMDRFYRQDYDVWQGRVNKARLARKPLETLSLLSQRPGIFARSLFSNMLWFGPDAVLESFEKLLQSADGQKLPLRLLFTLGMYADTWFDANILRVVKPLGGNTKSIPPSPLLRLYTPAQRDDMKRRVRKLYTDALRRLFANQAPSPNTHHPTIYIDPQLDHIPLAIGDRSSTIQDASAALQGTRFEVEGDAVRLFMQWGKGMPAQHLDMDLSCRIIYDNRVEDCAYYNLSPAGARHSGDIRAIPDQIGTAEYVELDLPTLEKNRARYVSFSSNAYSTGNLAVNLVVGWMSSASPMTVSDETGVAYDPSTVQHQVRINESNLAKGLVFGVLEVAKREIIWLEIPFGGQTIQTLNIETVQAYLNRLAAKTTIGQVLRMKAEVQQLQMVEKADEADEAYTMEWAKDTAAVSRLLMGPS